MSWPYLVIINLFLGMVLSVRIFPETDNVLLSYQEIPHANLEEQLHHLMAIFETNEEFIQESFPPHSSQMCRAHTINEAEFCIYLDFVLTRADANLLDFFRISGKDESFLVENNYPDATFQDLADAYAHVNNDFLLFSEGNCPGTPKSDAFLENMLRTSPAPVFRPVPDLSSLTLTLHDFNRISFIEDQSTIIRRFRRINNINQLVIMAYYRQNPELCRKSIQNDVMFAKALRDESIRLGVPLTKLLEDHRLNHINGRTIPADTVVEQMMAAIRDQVTIEIVAFSHCHYGVHSPEYSSAILAAIHTSITEYGEQQRNMQEVPNRMSINFIINH